MTTYAHDDLKRILDAHKKWVTRWATPRIQSRGAEYKRDIVPALLRAGGRALAEVATQETWACHSWQNCPMAEAFRVHDLSDIPPLYRWQAERFIQLFD